MNDKLDALLGRLKLVEDELLVEMPARTEQFSYTVDYGIRLNALQSFVDGDAVRLQQVFWNVLKNAVKFTPAKGKITLETFVNDAGQLLIKITDTGIGMSDAEVERIFTAFAQGDHASGDGGSHRFGGLGLGLAISKNLVELRSAATEVGSLCEPTCPAARSAPPFQSRTLVDSSSRRRERPVLKPVAFNFALAGRRVKTHHSSHEYPMAPLVWRRVVRRRFHLRSSR